MKNHFSTSLQNDDVDSDYTTSETTSSTPLRHRLFEKPLTPSDVGKLNRLVIPKQHAEKHFPLHRLISSAGDNSSSSAPPGDNSSGAGVLLGFEDEIGKCWRFRYSYWNSSQSYVLTKGWSRYVKEKKLHAGDVVLFDRHRLDRDRFFIGWRRRCSGPVQPVVQGRPVGDAAGQRLLSYNHHHHNLDFNAMQRLPMGCNAAPQLQQIAAFQYHYHPDFFHAGTEVRQQSQNPRKPGGVGNSKRVRLFGVNLDCQPHEQDEEDEPQTSDGSSLSSQGPGSGPGMDMGTDMGRGAYHYFDSVGYHPNHNHHNYMDINLPQDVNQMRE